MKSYHMSTITAFEKEIKIQTCQEKKYEELFFCKGQKTKRCQLFYDLLILQDQTGILRTFNTGSRSTFFVHEIQGNRTDPKDNWKQEEH